MRFPALAIICLVLAACDGSDPPDLTSPLDPADVRSGEYFLTPETQALQADEFANPGYLWVEQGQDMFETPANGQASCQSCHADGLRGAAATFPKMESVSGDLVNLEGQINLCRVRHQKQPALAYESDDLLSLTAFLASRSQGMPLNVSIDGEARAGYELGKTYFFTRRGQFNLSCAQCHNDNWGQQLRGDTISQGHLNGFPAYRLEWQAVGSSHRRLRDCDMGVRAEALPFGDPTYIAVELYLAHRASGLEVKSPAIRR